MEFALRRAACFLIACIIGLITFTINVAVHQSLRTAYADTVGANTDVFEPNASISSPWWIDYGSLTLTQRYGCTVDPIAAPYEDPAGECPNVPGYGGRWHQGIDIGTTGASINIKSAVEGTIADWQFAGCQTCSTLGFVAIRTLGGQLIYLLHGDITIGFRSLHARVHVGDFVYVTASNGGSTGFHLHFEVHASQLNELAQHPGDDINPEGWLFGSHYNGQQLASWVGGNPDIQSGPELDQLWFSPNDDQSQARLQWSSGNGSFWSYEGSQPLTVDTYSYPVVVSVAPTFYDGFSTTIHSSQLTWIQVRWNQSPQLSAPV